MRHPNKYSKLIILLHFVSLAVLFISIVAFIKSSSNGAVFSENNNSRIGVSGFTDLNKWSMDTDALNCDASFVISDGRLNEI